MNGEHRVTSLSLAAGQLLRAEAATDTPDDRVRSGILVPWGEPGRTNLGLKKVHRGALTLTADAKIVGIYGHNREAAVSRVVSTEDRPEGLFGRIKVARTALGDQLLAEIDDGARDALSIEFSDLEFDAAGDVTAARLDFVAHVPVGAYDSARIDLAATVNDTTGAPPVTQPDTLAAAPADDVAALRAEIAELRTALPSAASVLSTAGLPAATGGTLEAAADPIRELATMQAEVFRGREGDPQLRAALADITNSGLDLFQNAAGTIGEKLWEGAGYSRRFVPLMRHQPLTSWKYKSWQWVGGPKMAAYAGDKAAIPTNTWSVEEFEHTATRLAGGWDIDRKFRDFSDAEFWAELYRQQTESYLEESDAVAAAALVSYARDISVDANVPTEYAGVNVAQADVLRAVALGTAILEDTPRVRRGPDYVLMNTADWLGLMDLTNLDLPAFLALLKVSPQNFQRTSEVPAGKVVLGITQGSTFRELGGTPIRVEALDVARAGVDSAVFGYTGVSHDRPGSIISVPLVAG
jgi:HK97 family phage prohead protease